MECLFTGWETNRDPNGSSVYKVGKGRLEWIVKNDIWEEVDVDEVTDRYVEGTEGYVTTRNNRERSIDSESQ